MDLKMPEGQRGFCVLMRGQEHERGGANMHEWVSVWDAERWLSRSLGERFTNKAERDKYFIADSEGRDIDDVVETIEPEDH